MGSGWLADCHLIRLAWILQNNGLMFNFIRSSQVWSSIFRHGIPRDRRTRVMAVMSNVFLHLHPVAVRKSGIRLSFTWCMGGLTFFLFLAETISGVLLMFYYRPVVEYAYVDIQALRAHITLGVLREIHRWGAHAMIIAIWLHMMRVFLTGSYKPPREFNWGVGVILLVLTMLLSFTGYLLPWDQLAIWAITVGSNMGKATPLVGMQGPFTGVLQIGGVPLVTPRSDAAFMLLASTSVGENTLMRFYVLHCIALPLVAATLIAIHFWRIRKDGGISGPL
jgi:cytochrome b6